MSVTLSQAQVRVGAGFVHDMRTTSYSTNSNVFYSASGSTVIPLSGFYAGLTFSLDLGAVTFDPGVYYSLTTGERKTLDEIDEIITGTVTEHNITVPMHFNYGVDLGSAVRLSVYAGPSVEVGLSSTYKIDTSSFGIVHLDDATDMYEDSDYSRLDILAGAGLAVDLFDMFRISVGYDFGLLDRNKADNCSVRDRILHAGIAFLF